MSRISERNVCVVVFFFAHNRWNCRCCTHMQLKHFFFFTFTVCMNYDKVTWHGSLLIPQKKKKSVSAISITQIKSSRKCSGTSKSPSKHEVEVVTDITIIIVENPETRNLGRRGDSLMATSAVVAVEINLWSNIIHPHASWKNQRKKKKNNNMFSVRFLFVEKIFSTREVFHEWWERHSLSCLLKSGCWVQLYSGIHLHAS